MSGRGIGRDHPSRRAIFSPCSSIPFSEFRVSTDASGNIVAWALQMQFLNGSAFWTCNAAARVVTGSCTGQIEDRAWDAPISAIAANFQTPGVFTLVLVPEPTSAVLLGMGLVALARRGQPGGVARR